MPRSYYHVRPVAEGWAIGVDEDSQPVQVFPSKEAAEHFAKACAQRMNLLGGDVSVRVHGADVPREPRDRSDD